MATAFDDDLVIFEDIEMVSRERDKQFSSSSFLTENSLPVLRSVQVCPCWSLSVSLSKSWNFTHLAVFVSSTFATWTGFDIIGSGNLLRYGSDLCSP